MESARGGDPRQVARAELKLSKAFARYASDMRLAQGRDGLWRRGPEAQEAARRRGAAGSRTAQILQGLCGVDGMDEPPLSARAQAACAVGGPRRLRRGAAAASAQPEIGRASCRARVCQSVYISVVAVSLNKQTKNNQH